MTVHLEQVQPDQLSAAWPYVAQTLAEICERAPYLYTPQSIITAVLDGRYQLWLAVDQEQQAPVRGVAATHLHESDIGSRLCSVVFGASVEKAAFTDWVHLIGDIEQWARQQGCERMYFEGRRGYAKPMRAMGYQPGHMIFEKDLT